MVPANGNALYYAEDMLGSSRVIVQANGTPCYDGDFTPFGGERAYTSTCAQNYKFEGKERDTETQNDDFGARYYSWRLGRWLSADWSAVPAPVPYANLTNPQTPNLYAMVADDPESFADLDGHVVPPGAAASQEDCKAAVDQNCAKKMDQNTTNAAQNHGEGSQANLDRREAIAATAEKHDSDTSMPYTPGHPTCNLFVQKDIAEAGAPKPEVKKPMAQRVRRGLRSGLAPLYPVGGS